MVPQNEDDFPASVWHAHHPAVDGMRAEPAPVRYLSRIDLSRITEVHGSFLPLPPHCFPLLSRVVKALSGSPAAAPAGGGGGGQKSKALASKRPRHSDGSAEAGGDGGNKKKKPKA